MDLKDHGRERGAGGVTVSEYWEERKYEEAQAGIKERGEKAPLYKVLLKTVTEALCLL